MYQISISGWNAGALVRFSDYYGGKYTPEAVTKVADDLGLDHNLQLASAILQVACGVADEEEERRTITADMYYGRDE